jgi:protein-tyrosine phosphatase
MNRNFVDFHSHLLPAVDDGAVDQSDSLEMARALAAFGYTTVHCTPHLITGAFENTPERVTRATRSLQRVLHEAGIALKLFPSTEHYLDESLAAKLPGALTAGAHPFLLVEVPFRSGPELVPVLVADLEKHGLKPLFAHPERCRAFELPEHAEGVRGALSFMLGKPKEAGFQASLIASLQAQGCRFQGNIGSLAGVYGTAVQQRAVTLLKFGVYSCLGSDAHTSRGLAAILSEGYRVLVETVGEPAALRLLAGADFTP